MSELTLDIMQGYVLIEEVLIQAALALEAHDKFKRGVANCEARQSHKNWMHMQSTLTHTAMISKMLSPPRKSDVANLRSQYLMRTLNVDVSSILLDRTARNNVEHLDERLDRWISVGPKRIMQQVFEDRSEYDHLMSSKTDGTRRWFVRRAYILDEDCFLSECRDGNIDKVNFTQLRDELTRIRCLAETFLNAAT